MREGINILVRMKNLISTLKKEQELTKIMLIYRYASLFITSLFYILGNDIHSGEKKALIVSTISLSSILIHYLYIKNRNSISNIKILVLIETIGNSFLLIPSGGLSSPYVWYSLNTILISSVMLTQKYCWSILSFYLLNSTLVAYLVLENRGSFFTLLKNESNLILSFILITGIIQLLAKYAMNVEHKSNLLSNVNQELEMANFKNKQSLIHIMGMNQAVNLLTIEPNKSNLINIVLEYTQRITRTETAFFVQSIKHEKIVQIEGKEGSDILKDQIESEVSTYWGNLSKQNSPQEMKIEDKVYWFQSIKSNCKMYGVLGIETTAENLGLVETKEQLKFLANLSGIVFEKFELEQVNERLLINEEQNRIANEIHDGVLQKLFSISLGIYGITKNLTEETSSVNKADLDIIRTSLNSAMKDLRSTIYGLSWKKEGVNNFIAGIENYINEIKALNKVNILFSFNGNDELLSIAQKKALYRIITEGVGNAVRHGHASLINIELSVEIDNTSLVIMDNGNGFNVDDIEKNEKKGLGLGNIQHLANSFKGSLTIQSMAGAGTQLNIIIPTHKGILEEVVV